MSLCRKAFPLIIRLRADFLEQPSNVGWAKPGIPANSAASYPATWQSGKPARTSRAIPQKRDKKMKPSMNSALCAFLSLVIAAILIAAPQPANQGWILESGLENNPSVEAVDSPEVGFRQGEYQVSWLAGDAAYLANNQAQDLNANFLPAGIRVFPQSEADPRWQLGMRLTGWGYLGSVQSLAPGEMVVEGARVEYQRGPLTEWYLNAENGLEQGFTLADRPAALQDGRPLVLEIEIEGDLQPVLTEDRTAVNFIGASGFTELRYGGLSAFDSLGRTLNAWLELASDPLDRSVPARLKILVEDDLASYPLLIDPLLSSPVWTAEGNQHWAKFGDSLSSSGDVNGDGYDDLIVGAHLFDSGQVEEGKAFVFFGSASGLSTTAGWTAETGMDNTYFARAVGSAGDVNGDGYDDILIIGGSDNDPGYIENKAFLYLGSATGLGPNGTTTNADWIAETSPTNSQFYFLMNRPGDFNGDGFDDIMIATLSTVFAWYGGLTGMGDTGTPANADWTASAGAGFGHDLGSLGDLTGDGYDDAIIGSMEGAIVHVYSGSSGGLLSTPTWTATGTNYFGLSVSGGDVNGDGYADALIGDPSGMGRAASSGLVYAWYGSAAGLGDPGTPANADWSESGKDQGSRLGYDMQVVGDVDGDGFDDVVAGMPNGNTFWGGMQFYHGSPDGLIHPPSWSVQGAKYNDKYGEVVAPAGDVNGDGYADVAVSAVEFSSDTGYNNEYEGRVYVYPGSFLPERHRRIGASRDRVIMACWACRQHSPGTSMETASAT